MDKHRKEVLIVVYRSLTVGGIESNTYNIMKNALNSNRRVIWICDAHRNISPIYSELLTHPNFSEVRVNMSALNPWIIPNIDIYKDEKAVILAFSYFHLYYAYQIRKKYLHNKISVFFIVPHFVGSTIYPEESFGGLLGKYVNKIVAGQFKEICKMKSLLFFSDKHVEVFENKYKIKLIKSKEYVVPILKGRPSFSEEEVLLRWSQKPFKIVSAGRFEFPHKGYLLGLIKTFAGIREINPEVELHIYGDGPDEAVLDELLETIKDPKIRSGIFKNHSVSFDELMSIFSKSSLNISVAGCASRGAAIGLITLPARHYCTDCEVYGYFPESKCMTTESKPGKPVDQYIKEVMSMDKETYIKYSKAAYDSFNEEFENVSIEFPFDRDNDTSYIPSEKDMCLVKVIYILQRVYNNIFRIKQ